MLLYQYGRKIHAVYGWGFAYILFLLLNNPKLWMLSYLVAKTKYAQGFLTSGKIVEVTKLFNTATLQKQ
jgi:hypothetical protein